MASYKGADIPNYLLVGIFGVSAYFGYKWLIKPLSTVTNNIADVSTAGSNFLTTGLNDLTSAENKLSGWLSQLFTQKQKVDIPLSVVPGAILNQFPTITTLPQVTTPDTMGTGYSTGDYGTGLTTTITDLPAGQTWERITPMPSIPESLPHTNYITTTPNNNTWGAVYDPVTGGIIPGVNGLSG